MKRALALLLVFAFISGAQAQRVKFQTSGTVTFAPSPQALVAALSCSGCAVLPPSVGSASTTVRVLRQGNRTHALETRHDGWRPSGELRLEVRYTVRGNQSGVILASDWLPLDQSPASVFSGSDPVTDVEVEYRLQLTGQERSGTFETTVQYRVDGDTVGHTVRVVLPEVAAVRVVTKAGSSPPATVTFDYEGARALDYLRAVQTATPLSPTGGTLERVEVLSNVPGTFTVLVGVVPRVAPGDSAATLLPRLLLNGNTANAQRLGGAGPTAGFVTLVEPEDFSLRVVGDEGSSFASFELRYTLTRP